MRHAVLGAGGIGLLVGGALARAGRDVLLLLRPETLEAFGGTIEVESAVLGDFTAPARAATLLAEPVDVLWIATKATTLDAAVESAPPEHVSLAVPLLNGVDHVERLRRRYAHVLAATISVESERTAVGRVRQTSPFLRVVVGPGGEPVAEELRAAGLPDVSVGAGESAVLWSKLAFLAPIALTTSAAAAPVGDVRDDAAWRARLARCRAEVCALAAAEGAPQDERALAALVDAAAPEMRSSMQKDVDAGRPPELDAIGGAVLRAADRHGIPAPATAELVELVAARAAS
jgi:2-dehydropantoate 2-reductase